MNKVTVMICLLLNLLMHGNFANAVSNSPKFIEKGVICDIYFCVNREGVSVDLTRTFLGEKKANKIAEGSESRNRHEFTFSNGVHCKTKIKKCFTNRFYNQKGEVDGVQREDYTNWLFGSDMK
ncbi:YcgJ family protein [Enterobacter ludwigii]